MLPLFKSYSGDDRRSRTAWFWMTDRPAEARWLNAEERGWLTAVMDKERRVVEAIGRISVLKTLVNPQVLAIAAIHFAQAGVSVGIAVFTALIIKQLGFTIMQTGFMTAVPYVLGTIGILVWGHISDRMNERRWNLAASDHHRLYRNHPASPSVAIRTARRRG